MVRAIVKGIDNNIGWLVYKGIDIVLKIIEGIRKRRDELTEAGVKLIIQFVRSLSKAIDEQGPEIRSAAADLGWAILRGIGDGIDAGWGWLTGRVEDLAGALLSAATSKLKINSPSKVFSDVVGRAIPEGVGMGIDKHAGTAIKASEELANKSLSAMTYAFKNSKNAANGMMDIRPKIAPILDLTQLERDASQIGSKLGRHTISADVSRGRARDISATQAARRRSDNDVPVGDTYNFNQEIKSPEPVNHVKVYRGTKSQIALFKEVTGK
jgi:hypothetical protein